MECQFECPVHAAPTSYLMSSVYEELWILWMCNVDSQEAQVIVNRQE
jgi:hypothetical protein